MRPRRARTSGSAAPGARAGPEAAGRAAGHGLLASLRFAWDGLVDGALRDRNLRIHLALGALVGAFVARAPLAPAERGLLLLCVVLVIAAESANSAIEAAVDLSSPGPDGRARFAKDASAGAVLATAAGSVLAFAAVVGPRLGAIVAAAGALLPPAASALVVAAAAAFLPSPIVRTRATDVAVTAAGAAGLVHVAVGAASAAGTAAAGLCLAVAVAAALRRRARPGS
jgi:diacylglycerol kinase (ATP)